MKKELRQQVVALPIPDNADIFRFPNILIEGVGDENNIRTFFNQWNIIPACVKGRTSYPYYFTFISTDAGIFAIPIHDLHTLKTKYHKPGPIDTTAKTYKEFQDWIFRRLNKGDAK